MDELFTVFLKNYCITTPIKRIIFTSSGDKLSLLKLIMNSIKSKFIIDYLDVKEYNNIVMNYIESNKVKYEQVRNKYAFNTVLEPLLGISVDFEELPLDDELKYVNRPDLLSLKYAEKRYSDLNGLKSGILKEILKNNKEHIDLFIFSSSDIMTYNEYEYVKEICDAFIFTSDTFYKYNDVINEIVLSKKFVLYSSKHIKMFVKNEIVNKYITIL